MKTAEITFTIKLTFQDTRQRGVIPVSTETEFVKEMVDACRRFEEGRGLCLVKDSITTRFKGGHFTSEHEHTS